MWPFNAGTSTCQDGDHTEFEDRVEMCYNGVGGGGGEGGSVC